MGAIFLYRENAALCHEDARQVFRKKGFGAAREFELGVWRLWTHRKMLIDTDNFIQRPDGRAVFACGTVAYRGLGYRATLERLVRDDQEETIQPEALIGNYVILFWDGAVLRLLTDPLHAQHLFVDDKRTCLTTSFLALLAASPAPRSLNRVALCEKLATGSIVSPDTLVDGIQQVDDALQETLPATMGLQVVPRAHPMPATRLHTAGFDDSVRRQLAVLERYFRDIVPLDAEWHAELGLSSGYDSRLLLALSQFLPQRIPLHSHRTAGVHESELGVAERLARIGGHRLTVVPTTLPEEMDEERRREVLLENLYFFDGRCLHDMGSFSETYTAAYRQRVLGNQRLSLHGLGGEIYRNVYFTPPGLFRWADWADCDLFFPFAPEVGESAEVFQTMRTQMDAKIGRRLGIDLTGRADFQTVRDYYGLVRMPDFACNVNNAYGQMAFLLTPFVESCSVQEALRATAYIGSGGAYEGAMIRTLSPELAAVMSQYGHALHSVPLRHALRNRVACAVPLRWRRERRRRLASRGEGRRSAHMRYKVLRTRSPIIGQVDDVLRTVLPMVDWDRVTACGLQKVVALSVGSLLLQFQNKVRVRSC